MFRFLHSLRWRLQVWHALILLLVILGFGSVIYSEIRRSHWERVDDELLDAARLLEGTLRSVPRQILDSIAQDLGQHRGPRPPPGGPLGGQPGREGGPPGGLPGRDRRPPLNRNSPPRDIPSRGENLPSPPDDRMRPPIQVPWNSEIEKVVESMSQQDWEKAISLPRSFPEQMGRRDGPVYFVLWREDETILKESAVPESRPSIPQDIEYQFHRERYLRQQRGPYHEIYIRGPHRTLICVGRSVMDEQRRIQHLTLILVSAGASILAIGMLGGWWLSRRAIAPIQKMSQTAEEIQSNTLSRRVDIKGFDTEFSQLGKVLNSMFDRLNDAFQQQRRFVADASHEMRTPLSVIMSSTELALSKERGPDEYRMQLETCQRSAHRMHQLVESLLMLARLDGTQTTESATSVDLSKLVEERVSWLEPLAGERQIQFETNLQSSIVNGHPNLLNQVITNLVVNAIQYNRPGGKVRVETKSEDEQVLLIVEDNGIGIPSNDIPHLFERFYRVDQARSRNSGGIGLGLAICHRIIELHHGTIEVSSSVGDGSKFTVRFPSPTSTVA